MIRTSESLDAFGNKEGSVEDGKNNKVSYNSKSWSGLKDPRIVRVSRSFGGKDRHSKVRTIRGLRDRRVRLSVSTAIQLYDLQDRLGLNQPSKVVDWLLKVAEHEIDELPPLPIPQDHIGTIFPESVMTTTSRENAMKLATSGSISSANLEGEKYPRAQSLSFFSNIKNDSKLGMIGDDAEEKSLNKLHFGSSFVSLRSDLQYDDTKEMIQQGSNLGRRFEQGNQSHSQLLHNQQIMAQNLFNNQPFHPNLFINALPYNPYVQRDSNPFLSQLINQVPNSEAQPMDTGGSKNNSIASSLSLSSGSHFLLYRHHMAGPSVNPSPPLELIQSGQFSSNHPQIPNNLCPQSITVGSLSSPSTAGQSNFRPANYDTTISNIEHFRHNNAHSPADKGKSVTEA